MSGNRIGARAATPACLPLREGRTLELGPPTLRGPRPAAHNISPASRSSPVSSSAGLPTRPSPGSGRSSFALLVAATSTASSPAAPYPSSRSTVRLGRAAGPRGVPHARLVLERCKQSPGAGRGRRARRRRYACSTVRHAGGTHRPSHSSQPCCLGGHVRLDPDRRARCRVGRGHEVARAGTRGPSDPRAHRGGREGPCTPCFGQGRGSWPTEQRSDEADDGDPKPAEVSGVPCRRRPSPAARAAPAASGSAACCAMRAELRC